MERHHFKVALFLQFTYFKANLNLIQGTINGNFEIRKRNEMRNFHHSMCNFRLDELETSGSVEGNNTVLMFAHRNIFKRVKNRISSDLNKSGKILKYWVGRQLKCINVYCITFDKHFSLSVSSLNHALI